MVKVEVPGGVFHHARCFTTSGGLLNKCALVDESNPTSRPTESTTSRGPSISPIFIAITTQLVREALTCGTLSCVVVGLGCDARNMVSVVLELWSRDMRWPVTLCRCPPSTFGNSQNSLLKSDESIGRLGYPLPIVLIPLLGN